MKGKLETVNSKTIVENYTNITNDFDDLFLILRNDSSVVDIKRSYYKQSKRKDIRRIIWENTRTT